MRAVLTRPSEPPRAPEPPPSNRSRTVLAAVAGPALIVVLVVFAMRGLAFRNDLSNQHPDILAFWLPHFCFLGQSLAHGHIPLWNPHQMAGMPYAADPQSGWLYLPAMALFSTLSCGTALRMFIVLQPLMAGLGLYWFLRKERLHRVTATAGGLSLGMLIAASNVGLSLPFAGMLAWTPFALVGASGFLSATRWPARLGWLALAAVAWGQVAAAHMSHGLAMASLAVAVYVVARTVRRVREGQALGPAVALALLFMAFLPFANLALFIPRMALFPSTSLRGGYASVGGAVARLAGIADQPLAPSGVWSGWPLALGSAPGGYVGAIILLAIPAALRVRSKRYLAVAFGIVGLASYVLTLNFFVRALWYRKLVLSLPYGDVYLHNPGRLRYLLLLAVPVLGALGIQGLIERPLPARRAAAWIGAGVGIWLVLPVLLGAHPVRMLLLLAGAAAAFRVLMALGRGRRWAGLAVVGVLAVELLGSAIYSQAYAGGTVFLGLEHSGQNLVSGPLRWPDVPVDDYLRPGRIARALQGQRGRYITWAPPTTYYLKGYLFTQDPDSWPALENGRGMLFGLHDVLGYDPVQLTRYWSYIRATNDGTPLFYNASVIRNPSVSDVRLLSIRYLIAPTGLTLPLRATPVTREGRFTLYRLRDWQPMVSVIRRWRVAPDGAAVLRRVLQPQFDPSQQGVVLVNPGIAPSGGGPGRATFHELSPEHIRIQVATPGSSLVVVRNAFDSGWTATVDGKPSKVLAADYLLQAIPVTAGHHTIELVYRDPPIARGLVASAAVWGLLVLGLAVSLLMSLLGRGRRRRGPRPDGPDDEPASPAPVEPAPSPSG
ncbi:MAG: YfhO family protein [Actinomycetota bacterium]|nr:YfhO family protein [Actinomycetota bacterium]